jgi:hypothetical protein
MLSVVASVGRAETLVLVSLTCHEPEDANWDEPELQVNTGDGITHFYLPVMTRGSVERQGGRIIGRVLMDGRASVQLWDLDNGRDACFDSDDNLGLRNIPPDVTNGIKTVTFNRDGANYTLRYRVDP